jgi:hypothetical protein
MREIAGTKLMVGSYGFLIKGVTGKDIGAALTL